MRSTQPPIQVAPQSDGLSIASGLAAPLAAPLAAIVSELGTVVGAATPEQFVRRCGDQFFDATIGGHVRHCLDHVRALVEGVEKGEINYDHRERGTQVETSVDAARAEVQRLVACLVSLGSADLSLRLRVRVMPTRDSGGVFVESTVGRELSFVLSHTIHHNAMVRGMALAVGVRVPESFGYAPSTLAHRDADSCVR